MTVQEVAARFPGGKWRNGTYETKCQSHDDRRASLGISQGRNGGVVISCQAGCKPEAVLAAVGLTLADLMPPSPNGARPAIEAVYRYDDEEGNPLFEVCRLAGKQFWQRLPGAERGGIGEVRRVLFGLPDLLKSAPGSVVAICEGEKDCLNLRKRGLIATTNPIGAGKWRPEYTAWLKERLPDRQFVLFADQDQAGIDHAEAVHESLKRAGLKVRAATLSGLAAKEDVSDWLGRHSEAELQELLKPAPPSLWPRLLSFQQLLVQPSPEWLIEGLFMEQTMVEFFGPPNEGKTFVVVDACMALRQGRPWCGRAVNQKGPILFVSADGGLGFADRARAWVIVGQQTETDEEFWTLPEPINLYRADAIQMLGELIAYLPKPPKVLAIDTYSRCIPGVNENQQEFASMVVDNLTGLMREFHLSPWLLHHSDKTGQHDRGSSVILGACDTQIRVGMAENIISMKCEKQRDAPRFEPIYMDLGRVPETNETWVMWRPEGAPPKNESQRIDKAAIWETVRLNPGITRAELYRQIGLPKSTLERYVRQLLASGALVERDAPPEGEAEGAPPKGLYAVITGD